MNKYFSSGKKKKKELTRPSFKGGFLTNTIYAEHEFIEQVESKFWLY